MPDTISNFTMHYQFVEKTNRKQSVIVHRLEKFTRRALDIFVSLFGLILLSPLFILIAFLIKRDSSGSVFYRGPRLGKQGHQFGILKFRTMYDNLESYHGPKVTALGDKRITPIGQWLRETKINELPQLWNVLIGDMSLVGPRPEDPEVANSWPQEVLDEFLSVRPGITSPASVVYRDEETLLESPHLMDDYLRRILPSKLRLDTLYIRNRNLLTDMDIIFWTLVVLIPQIKRRPIPEYRLYSGPLARFVRLDFSWFMMDLPVSFAAIGVTGLLWRTGGPLDLGWGFAVVVAIVIALFFSIINALLGLNRVFWSKARPSEALELAFSSALVTIGLVVVNHFFGDLLLPYRALPSGLLLVTGFLAFAGFVGVRYRERILTGIASRWLSFRGIHQTFGERVLIIGAGEVGEFAVWLLRKGDLARAFSIVGLIDDDPRKQGMRIEGLKVLGSTKNIPELVGQYDIGLVLFSISRITLDERDRILNLCTQTSARLVIIPDILQMMQIYFSSDSPDDLDENLRNGVNHYGAEIESEQVSHWLNELEDLVKGGNLDSVRNKIKQIREELG
jgi:lipopolysaccharide/colanic/teichoic acid biosynthesis glycosyltransferase